jgi:hypothetical protein
MLVQTINLVHAPTMVLLIFNNQLFDDCITGLPTDELRASHYTHQNQTRMGLHEEIPCLQQQEIGVTAVQTYQDTGAALADTGVPPYLKRKLLMRHDGMICSTFNVIRKEVDRQTATDRTSRTSCNCDCKASEGKLAILGDSDTSTVSDDSDWIHSDCSDNDLDEDEAQRQLGVRVGPNRNREFPPRVRLLRRRYLLMNRHDDHGGKVTAALERPWQIHQDSPCPGRKRKRNDTEMTTAMSKSKSYDRNSNDDLDDESTTTKRQRLGSRYGCPPDIIQRVDGLGGLPSNTDGACEVAEPPIPMPGHLSEASVSSVGRGRRRSQRIWKKWGSVCGTSPTPRS